MVVEGFAAWAPGVETLEAWESGTEIEDSSASPKLAFASAMATRRLSQLTKLTCYMAGRIGLAADELFFSSVRGEINSQLKINLGYAEEGEMKPASFSLSVFNTPPAEATILLKSQIPYTALFSGETECIRNLYTASSAPILSGRDGSTIMIYAEERTPAEYRNNVSSILPAMVLGVKLGSGEGIGIPAEALSSPMALDRYLIENEISKLVF